MSRARCLQTEGEGDLAHATDCTTHDGQRLMLQRYTNTDGSFDSAQALWSTRCLSVDGLSALSLGPCKDSRDQTIWGIDNRTSQFENLQLSNGAYTNACLTDLTSENQVTLEDCDDTDPTQRWDVRPFYTAAEAEPSRILGSRLPGSTGMRRSTTI
ncbi:RICIN domain-containing protein [Streptomyces sp. NBC_00212]